MSTKSRIYVRSLCEGAIMLAVALVLNYLSKVVFANMPNGGSVTLAMFPILFYAHRWGVGRGLLMGFAYGLLDMLLDGGYAWGWQSIILDYLVAFTPLGLAGLFKGKAWGIFPGILLGNLGRFIVHYISGITIYRIYEPTEIPGIGTFDGAELYSLVYNGSYMLPCALLAIVMAALLYVPMKRYFAGSDLQK